MANQAYRAQILKDRREAAKERRQAEVSGDNDRIELIYADCYAISKHAALKAANRTLPRDLVVYPDLDLQWRRI
jgi:hypothetical protein